MIFPDGVLTLSNENIATALARANGTTVTFSLFDSYDEDEENDDDNDPLEIVPLLVLQIGSPIYYLNGVEMTGDTIPYIDPDTNRTMLPLRLISEAMGANVHWDEGRRTVTIMRGLTVLTLIIGEPLPGNMGTTVIIDGRTFVHARYIAEMLGARVEWDEAARAVYINI